MQQLTRDDIELIVMHYYSQQRIDVFNKVAPTLNKKNFKLLIFPQLENYDAMGIRHIFRVVGTEETIHEYPQDWWQMLKDRWFPSWMKKLFPVKMNRVVAHHLFPYCHTKLGDEVTKVIVRKENNNGKTNLD